MSTNTESTSVNCILCGHAIAQGEPCHAIFTGIYAGDNVHTDSFNENGALGLACGCVLRAAERHAKGLAVFDDDCTVTDYVEHIKCMNKATEPDKEQSYRRCPMCESGAWVDDDYEGTIRCSGCNWPFHHINRMED